MTYEEAKRRAYKRLAMRPYHSSEMRQFLAEKGASPSVIAQVVGELSRLGYLNDEEWVIGTIRSLTARKYGPKMIAYKLSLKGIQEEEFLPLLESSENLQQEQIEALLSSKYKNRDFSSYKERQKIIAALVRKGFDFSEIFKALSSFSPSVL